MFTSLVELSETASFIIALLAISITVGSTSLLLGRYDHFIVIAGSVSLAFLPHELMHRHVARKMGCYSRFVLYPLGLMLTLITAIPLFPIKFIMPGFVLIASHYYDPVIRKRIEGVTAVVGPLTNIFIALIGLALFFTIGAIHELVKLFLWCLVYVNSIISFLNLLPVPPLDGSKILAWKPATWVLLFLTTLMLMYYSAVFL